MDIKNLVLDPLPNAGDVVAVKPVKKMSLSGIAIIGMAGKVGDAEDLASFWTLLAEGRSAIREIPATRKQDIKEYLRLAGALDKYRDTDYLREAYLPRIDNFDYAFFGLSKQEANLMDPQQRLFLETAWAALEDSGYASDAIRGSKTGIFVGASQDFGEDYRRLIDTLAPDAPDIAIVGNIKSVIASRIAYLLDLKGPSLMVDTACSSALVALHLACRSLNDGECDMAMAGTVNMNLVPLPMTPETGIGARDIQDNLAADNQTKAFDERSDGMSVGEGVFAFLLKPLQKAVDDGDQIHAVIRGSAINQDGYSVGLTAPNSAAQAELIKAAWRNAGVNGRDISYIEAHGTGTTLGDPVEISGIRQAFGQTTRHKQFCGIGSVKSNVGHLDNAAGLASLAKVVLALKHRQLPASLHFQQPNGKIPFDQSPVYVNDRLQPWTVAGDKPLLAGISSFGLSGTNCHAIVQAADDYGRALKVDAGVRDYLLPISAKSESALKALAAQYGEFLNHGALPSFQDMCFTATVGRMHHSHRAAFVFRSVEELRQAIELFLEEKPGNYLWSSFRVVADDPAVAEPRMGYVTEGEQELLSSTAARRLQNLPADVTERRAALQHIADVYCQGAEVPWTSYLRGQRVSLPVYPFEPHRCWVEATTAGETLARSRRTQAGLKHPFLDQVLNSRDLSIYRVTLSAQRQWALADHKVQGVYVLPGTCYLEMMLAIAANMAGANEPQAYFDHIQFLTPFIVGDNELRDLHLQVTTSGQAHNVSICSQDQGGAWLEHATASFQLTPGTSTHISVEGINASLPHAVDFTIDEDVDRGLEIGDRWYRSFQYGQMDTEKTDFLFRFSLPETYANELDHYFYHPALLDAAINAANHLMGDGELYLPFFYRGLRVHRRMPGDCFIRLQRTDKREGERDGEIVTFQVQLMDVNGQICATVDHYGIKKAVQFQNPAHSAPMRAFALSLVPDMERSAALTAFDVTLLQSARLLVIHQGEINEQDGSHQQMLDSNHQETLVKHLQQSGAEVLCIRQDQPEYEHELNSLSERHTSFDGIVYAAAWQLQTPDEHNQPFIKMMDTFNSLVRQKIANAGSLVVLTHQAFGEDANPLQAAIASFARVAAIENPQLSLLNLDINPAGEIHEFKALAQALLGKAGATPVRILRDGQWQREQLDTYKLANSNAFTLRDDGVYLITGGTGGLGLELALELARQAKSEAINIKLALTSTTAMPPAEEWSDLLAIDHSRNDTSPRLRERLQKLQAIRALGAEVFFYQINAAHRDQTTGLLSTLRNTFGAILGVVHAAGRAGDGFLINKTSQQMHDVLAPKVQGAWWLHELTTGDSLDFFVLYSSIASHFHEAGQSDYTAANRFMDALASYRRQFGLPALAVCWPAWRETGIAVEYNAVNEDELFHPINTADALQMLRAAMVADKLPAALVLSWLNTHKTVTDFDQVGMAYSPAVAALLKGNGKSAPAADNQRPVELSGVDVPDEFDVMVGEVWARVLGLAELHADDAFNDLGGNSILVTQKYKEFEGRHPGVMDMADLFTHTTLREQAAFFRKALAPKTSAPRANDSIGKPLGSTIDLDIEQELEAQLARLAAGEISLEEAQALV